MDLDWQPSLSSEAPSVDASFEGLVRTQLDEVSWIDHVPAFVRGSDEVFDALVRHARWDESTRMMYGTEVAQPRLTASWRTTAVAEHVPVIEQARVVLSKRYGEDFDRGGLNLYRDGRDSVAWHVDKIPPEIDAPTVGIVSVGATRRFRVRPRGGGSSRAWDVGPGDLIVTGGMTQRRWEHAVLKVAFALPRISITFRHGPR